MQVHWLSYRGTHYSPKPTVKCPIMSRTKSSHSGHYETSVPAIWDIMRLSYMAPFGTIRDITRLFRGTLQDFVENFSSSASRAPP